MPHWFLQLNLISQFLLVYSLLINMASFFYIGIDKMKAQLNPAPSYRVLNHARRCWINRRRISEKTLWLLALLGGSLGTLLGMHWFRHKTKKISFQAILAMILALQVWVVYWIIHTWKPIKHYAIIQLVHWCVSCARNISGNGGIWLWVLRFCARLSSLSGPHVPSHGYFLSGTGSSLSDARQKSPSHAFQFSRPSHS